MRRVVNLSHYPFHCWSVLLLPVSSHTYGRIGGVGRKPLRNVKNVLSNLSYFPDISVTFCSFLDHFLTGLGGQGPLFRFEKGRVLNAAISLFSDCFPSVSHLLSETGPRSRGSGTLMTGISTTLGS